MTTPEDTQAQPVAGEPSLQQKFFRYFQHEVTALQEQMDRLGDRPLIAGERADAADHCLAGISRLSSEVKDASTYLPPYDQRTYAEAIKALQDKLQETRASFAPKPKFSFKSARKSPSAISLSDAAELAAQKRRGVPGYLSPNANTPGTSASGTPAYLQTPPNEQMNRPVPDAPQPPSSLHQSTSAPNPSDDQTPRPALSSTSTSTTISSQSHTQILLPRSTALTSPTPCTITRLSHSVLDLTSSPSQPHTTSPTSPFATLTLTNTTSSLLSCGLIAGPAHVTNLRRSVLVIACRQLRMHDCRDVDVYLHCTSRPIIEDCEGIRFAPLPATYCELLKLPSPSDSDRSAGADTNADDVRRGDDSAGGFQSHSQSQSQSPNLWDQVDDFKWLKSEPSPNWGVLPPEEKVVEETWREVVPGGPGWRVDDILRAVGVRG